MTRRLIMIHAMVLVLLAAGCAKRPAATGASAPAPSGAAGAAGAPAAGAPGAPAAAAPRVEPRAMAGEFAAVANVADIHFDFDKSAIRPGDAKILNANAVWLNANERHLVLIEGHCDERGTGEYNLALGERRARATMNYLVSRGVARARISVVSFGKERPLCTESTEPCWARNRRAHFLVKAQ
jgi:peptidoglycan-associated lipoprotein